MIVGEQTSLSLRKRRAGQRLFIGLEGPAVDDDLRRVVAQVQPSGFILFARNVVDPLQVRELNRALGELVAGEVPVIVSVDQEGGRVQRVREPAVRWPSMRRVGAAEAFTEQVSRAMAQELKAMGFHLNFAPVSDVDSNPDNPVIGDRSFGSDPALVAAHVATFVRAHQEAGVMACAKHFPGHGDTHMDSHLDLPVVDRPVEQLRALELVPFRRAIQAGVATIMTSHVMFPAWDRAWPATLSERILRPLLRQELGFEGVIFSDDMEMKAVAGRWPVPVQAQRATMASVDVLLCCRSPGLQLEMFEALVRLQEQSPGLEEATVSSVRRIAALQERLFGGKPRPETAMDAVGHPAARELADTVLERSEWLA